MAMMGHKHAKNQSNQKSSAGPNSSFLKKSVGRPKSACKGKADIFNSTAPIKFFELGGDCQRYYNSKWRQYQTSLLQRAVNQSSSTQRIWKH